MEEPCVAVVSSHADSLASEVSATLRARGIRTRDVSPGALGTLHVDLREDVFSIDGQPVGGIFFRSSPDSTFSEGFLADDRSFCDAEIGATWLAALHLESIVAVNRYDAIAWFEGLDWPVWRRRLIEAGIPVSPFGFGEVRAEGPLYWCPYKSCAVEVASDPATRGVLGSAVTSSVHKQTTLMVCNYVIRGEANSNVLDAGKLLHEAGVRLAQIATDLDGRILLVNTQPVISDIHSVKPAVDLLAGLYHAHLRRW